MIIKVESERISIVESASSRNFPRIPVALLSMFFTLFLGSIIWLFAPSDTGEVKPPPGLESLRYVDGKKNLEFKVPESSLRFFDVVHMRAHSSIGLPTRIYFKAVNGEFIAVYKTDAPANSGSGK
jgi:hypothetical protein